MHSWQDSAPARALHASVLHHMTHAQLTAMLREVCVLKPGGTPDRSPHLRKQCWLQGSGAALVISVAPVHRV